MARAASLRATLLPGERGTDLTPYLPAPFLVDVDGRLPNGEPLTLPHQPGEKAYGLVPGFWAIDEDGYLQGPYNSAWEAEYRVLGWPI